MKQTTILMSGFVLVLSVGISGCAGYGNATLPEQGKSVTEMAERQTAYPERVVDAGSPPLDGAIAERVVRTYRADTANREAVRNTIEVNLGGK